MLASHIQMKNGSQSATELWPSLPCELQTASEKDVSDTFLTNLNIKNINNKKQKKKKYTQREKQ